VDGSGNDKRIDSIGNSAVGRLVVQEIDRRGMTLPTEEGVEREMTTKPQNDLYQKALDSVRAYGHPNVCHLQDQLKIGSTDARRLINQMLKKGDVVWDVRGNLKLQLKP